MITVSRDHLFRNFDRTLPPVATVRPGESFVVETVPSSQQATGPIAVAGAGPGDALVLAIERIDLDPDASMWAKPGRGAFGERLSETLTGVLVRPTPLRAGHAIFSDRIAIPLRPMVGVLGIAPTGDPSPTSWPGRHGGNLDCRLVTEGNSIYLPVAAPGALIGIGDLHAAMGDGEIMLTGVETAGAVTVRAEIVRNWAFSGPWVETTTEWVALGSARAMDAALDVALRQMTSLLTSRGGLTFEEAGMLCSAAADCTICQVVNPQVTIRIALPKSLVPGLSLR